jgi:hypothetical protein
MGDPSEKKAAHCDVDHGLGDVETLLKVANEAPPADQPPEGSLDDPSARQRLESGLAVDAADDLDHEVEERRLVEQLGTVVGWRG